MTSKDEIRLALEVKRLQLRTRVNPEIKVTQEAIDKADQTIIDLGYAYIELEGEPQEVRVHSVPGINEGYWVSRMNKMHNDWKLYHIEQIQESYKDFYAAARRWSEERNNLIKEIDKLRKELGK